MSKRLLARVVVLTVFCPLALVVGSLEQVAHAGDQEAGSRGGFSLEGPPGMAGPTPAEEPEGHRAAWIVDNFEDGNIDGWEDQGGGACTASTSAIAAAGAYSMRVDGACAHFLGRALDMSTSTPTGITAWVRSNTVNTYDTYFILGNNQSGLGGNVGAILFYGADNGTWLVSGREGILSCGPRNANQWYQIEFNVDWACKMYDVSIDGVVKHRNVGFSYEPTESIDRIHVYNFSSATARYDEIYFFTPGVSPLIFSNGFERASTCGWSASVE